MGGTKSNRVGFILAATAAVALAGFSSSAQAAATQYWDVAGSGGTGPWDTLTTNWNPNSPTDSIVNNVVWTNGNDANFGGGGGTVTLNSAVDANSLTFAATSGISYTISGTGTLTLDGPNISSTGVTSANIQVIVTGSAGLTKSGASALGLSMANTYSGGTTINGGTVTDGSAANAAVLGSGDVTFGTNTGEILNLNAHNLTIGLLAGGATGVVENSSGSPGSSTNTLTLTGTDSQSFAGVIKNVGTRLVALKITAGTQTLTGTSSYTGGTTISGGRLIAGSTSALGTGAVAIGGGALELDPAVMIAQNLSLTAGTLQFDLATDNAAALTSTGATSTYSLADGTTVDLGLGSGNSSFYTSQPSWNLLSFHSGTIGAITITDYDTTDWVANLVDNGSGVAVLSFSAVPEPASLALLGLGGLALLRDGGVDKLKICN